jgi:hypothetical protein
VSPLKINISSKNIREKPTNAPIIHSVIPESVSVSQPEPAPMYYPTSHTP